MDTEVAKQSTSKVSFVNVTKKKGYVDYTSKDLNLDDPE